jgi:hypothetical protein
MGLVDVIGLDRMCDLNAGDRYRQEGPVSSFVLPPASIVFLTPNK